MKIVLKQNAKAADVSIPAGEYIVSLQTETQTVNLAGHGSDYRLPAIKRPNKKPTRITDVQFYPAGGANWSIVVRTPKYGEWLCTIRYENSDQ